MPLRVRSELIGSKLHRLLIFQDGQYIGEYERSQEADIERKKAEIRNAEAELLGIYRRHGEFVVRWDGAKRQKSVRVKGTEVGTVPRAAWERPSWEG